MKQMIDNHEAIESLKDFIVYDEKTGKIRITKPVVDGSGNPIAGAVKTILGQATVYIDTEIYQNGVMRAELVFDNQLNYANYDLFIFTIMGSTFIYLSSQVLNTNEGLKTATSMIANADTGAVVCKGKLNQTYDETNNKYVLSTSIVPASSDVVLNYETMPYGIFIGIKL